MGGVLLDKYNAYTHAQPEIFEYYVQYDGAWLKVQEEIQVLECLVDVLDQNLLRHFKDQLTILEVKLTASVTSLDRVVHLDGKVASKSYALLLKEPLTQAINELEQWSMRFKPSWFSTARTLKENLSRYISSRELLESSASRSLETLRRSLQMSQEDALGDTVFLSRLNLVNKRPLIHTSAIAANEQGDATLNLIVDEVETAEQAPAFTLDMKDIVSLAQKLITVNDPILWWVTVKLPWTNR